MTVPALKAPARVVLAAHAARILLLALVTAGIVVMGMMRIGRPASVAPPTERPVFARRMGTLPAIVVSAPADSTAEVVVRIR